MDYAYDREYGSDKNRRSRNNRDSSNSLETKQRYKYFGFVAWVKPVENHVLIKPYGSYYNVPIGKKLFCYNLPKDLNPVNLAYPPLDKISSVIELTTLRSGDFLTADIINGTPSVGNAIYFKDDSFVSVNNALKNEDVNNSNKLIGGEDGQDDSEKIDDNLEKRNASDSALNDKIQNDLNQSLDKNEKKEDNKKLIEKYEEDVDNLLSQ